MAAGAALLNTSTPTTQNAYQKVASSAASVSRLKAAVLKEGDTDLTILKASQLYETIQTQAGKPIVAIKDTPMVLLSKGKKSFVLFRNKTIGTGTYKTASLGLVVTPDMYIPAAIAVKNRKESNQSLIKEAKLHFKFNKIPEALKAYEYISFEGNEVLILEYCNNGNLKNFLDKYPNDDLLFKSWLAAKMYDPVAKMHQLGFAHRDLKPENYLLDNFSNILRIYLSDFGSVISLDDIQARSQLSGTMLYLPPEVVKASHLDGVSKLIPDEIAKTSPENWDKWSFGCILYELFSNEKLPWDIGNDRKAAAKHIMSLAKTDPSTWIKKKNIPPAIYKLLLGLFASDPAKRPSDKEICDQLEAFRLSTLELP